MNPAMIPLVIKGANSAYKYIRSQNDKRERDLYTSLLDGLKGDNLDDLHDKLDVDELEELYGAARAHAGDVTRSLHDNLDRRRAAFLAALPELENVEEEKGSTFGSVVKWTLGLGALAAGGWAVWNYYLSDKLNSKDEGKKDEGKKDVPTRTTTDARGNSTIVYSSRTEDARADQGADRGAEGVTTLDTLDDDQRKATS